MSPTTSKDWRRQLPRINEERRDTDKLQIRGRYKNGATNTYFYVAQGESVESFWLYWGFAVIPGRRFPIQLTVSSIDLETGVWLGNAPCKVDEQFLPGPWLPIKNIHFPPTTPVSLGRMNGRGQAKAHPHVLQ